MTKNNYDIARLKALDDSRDGDFGNILSTAFPKRLPDELAATFHDQLRKLSPILVKALTEMAFEAYHAGGPTASEFRAELYAPGRT